MGVKSVFQEVKTKVSPSRLFKALVTQSHDILPKATTTIKSVKIVEGNVVAPGCVYQTTFPEGSPFEYFKNRVDAVDHEKHVCKFTTVEGDVLGDKLEKVSYELKFEACGDGGSVVKVTTEYHTKGDAQLTDQEIETAKEQTEGLYKACEEYLIAHPHVCA